MKFLIFLACILLSLESLAAVQTLLDNPQGKIYFEETKDADAIILLNIKTPSIDVQKGETQVMADLYCDLLGSAATLRSDGISIVIHAKTTEAPRMIDDMLTKCMIITVDEQTFKQRKTELLRRYQNHTRTPPVAQANELLRSALEPDLLSPRAKAPLVRKVTYKAFQKFCKNVFRETYLQGIIYGGLTQEKAQTIVENALATLHSKPTEQGSFTVVDLPKNPLYYEVKGKCNENGALLAIQSPTDMPAVHRILIEVLREPFHKELQEQYHVAEAQEIHGRFFSVFAVESQEHDSRDLISHFELFLEKAGEVSPEQFEAKKRVVLDDLKKPRTSKEVALNLHKQMFYCGSSEKECIAACEQLTYEDFRKIASETLSKNNKQRFAIGITGSAAQNCLKYKKITSLKNLY